MGLIEDKEKMTKDIMSELQKQFHDFSKDHTVYGVFLFGSQNYGLATEESDIDTKVVIIPTMDDLLFKQPVSKTVETDRGLADLKDIRLYFNNLKKQNINFLETLFTEYGVYRSGYDMERMLAIREDIARLDEAKNIACMKGMFNQALGRYEAEGSNKQLANMVRLSIAMERYAKGQPYQKVIYVPNLISIKANTNDNGAFENFKKVTVEKAISFVDAFDMDCKPKNKEVEKKMDSVLKSIICSRLSL